VVVVVVVELQLQLYTCVLPRCSCAQCFVGYQPTGVLTCLKGVTGAPEGISSSAITPSAALIPTPPCARPSHTHTHTYTHGAGGGTAACSAHVHIAHPAAQSSGGSGGSVITHPRQQCGTRHTCAPESAAHLSGAHTGAGGWASKGAIRNFKYAMRSPCLPLLLTNASLPASQLLHFPSRTR
jgi:hypothetical protein